MLPRFVKNSLFAATGLSMAVAPCAAAGALAQSAPPPSGGYDQGYDQAPPPAQGGYDQGYDDQGPPPGYDQGSPPPGYDRGTPPAGGYNQAPPQGYAPPPVAPPGYDGTRPPPPPPGYQPGPADAAQRDQDQRYSAYAEQWARDNCVKAHGDAGTGALIGGALGAIIGSGFGGHGG